MATANPKVVTGTVRLSYAHLFEPYSAMEGQDPKYSVQLLIPKKDTKTIEALREAQQVALENGKNSKFGGKIPKNWKDTIRDGDEEDHEERPEVKGHWFVNVTANASYPPGIVDKNVNPILDQNEVYSGCYARVALNAFPFSVSGNAGVSFGLRNVQKVADGEPFGAISRAEDDFGVIDDGDDDLI